jgi:hypothetical protein
MAWTREQAIEYGKQNASKGGLARAARLSPERRFEIALMASWGRWRFGLSEIEQIDRNLNNLAMVEAYAAKNGDMEAYQKAIQAQLPWIKLRIMARRFEAMEKRAAEEQQRRRNSGW